LCNPGVQFLQVTLQFRLFSCLSLLIIDTSVMAIVESNHEPVLDSTEVHPAIEQPALEHDHVDDLVPVTNGTANTRRPPGLPKVDNGASLVTF
jgi:hypothetical protein